MGKFSLVQVCQPELCNDLNEVHLPQPLFHLNILSVTHQDFVLGFTKEPGSLSMHPGFSGHVGSDV